MIEYAVCKTAQHETPESETRRKSIYSEVRGVLELLLGEPNRSRAIQATNREEDNDPTKAPEEYRRYNKAVNYSAIPQPIEKRSKTDADLIEKIINTPIAQIFQALKMLSY